MFNIIIAHDFNLGIAKDNKIPWKISADLINFKKITTCGNYSNVLIMGRKTADSIGKPLDSRINIILSQNTTLQKDGYIVKNSLIDALELCVTEHSKSKIFIIGGSYIIREALTYSNLIHKIYITKVLSDYKCDVVIDNFYNKLQLTEIKSDIQFTNDYISYQFFEYTHVKKHCSEQQYLNILYDLFKTQSRQTRNAITKSLFSSSLTFDLRDGFPLLTTKKIFWKGIVYELLFFLAGHTDNKWLKNKGVHIWDKNSNKDFIENLKLNLKEDDIGPMYGFQWRHYGAEYFGANYDYTNKGKDQLIEVIDLLINNPTSRRILLTTYNYNQVKEGVLYPCHGLIIQFYVEDNIIHLQMYQRSVDYFLGLSFNIASYALLLHILVNYINSISNKNYIAGKINLVLGDYHLYNNHIKQAILQASRIPNELPKLSIKKNIESIDPKYMLNIDADNFQIINYNSFPAIKADMIA